MDLTRACTRLLLQARSGPIRQGILEGHRQLPPECSCLPRDQPCFLGGTERHTVSLGTTFSKAFQQSVHIYTVVSTSGEYCVDMHSLLKSLTKHRAQRYRVTFSAAEEAGLIARETGALRREMSMTLQDALSYRTRACLEKQALARSSQVHFTSSPAPTPTPPPEDPRMSASGNDEQDRGEGILRRRLDVENRGGGTGSSTYQRVDHRVGGKGGSEHQSNTRAGGNGGIHDRFDDTQARGNGDSASQQVDTPADQNRDGDL